MKQLKSTIIQKASLLFSEQGIAAADKGHVAKVCGISQDTISLLFASREILLTEVVAAQLSKTEQYLSIYSSISPDAITEIQHFFGCLEKMLDIFTPIFLSGLKNELPEVYASIFGTKESLFMPFVYQNLNRGINEGVYRPDLAKDATINAYFHEIAQISEESISSPAPDSMKLYHINNAFLSGIVNVRGERWLKHS